MMKSAISMTSAIDSSAASMSWTLARTWPASRCSIVGTASDAIIIVHCAWAISRPEKPDVTPGSGKRSTPSSSFFASSLAPLQQGDLLPKRLGEVGIVRLFRLLVLLDERDAHVFSLPFRDQPPCVSEDVESTSSDRTEAAEKDVGDICRPEPCSFIEPFHEHASRKGWIDQDSSIARRNE